MLPSLDSRSRQQDSLELSSEVPSRLGCLFRQDQLDKVLDFLDKQNNVPTESTYSFLLRACSRIGALAQAKRVYSQLARRGLESSRFLGEYVVSTLVQCGGLEEALQVFHRLPRKSVFSWTAVISGFARRGPGREALRLYRLMREERVQPNKFTLVSLLQACGSLSDLDEGKRIHAEAVLFNCQSDVFVGTCLVDMYAKCGSMVDAQNAFDGLLQKNVVSWTTMLGAYGHQGQPHKAWQLYEQLQEEGVSPDARTFVSALQVCGMLAEKEEAVFLMGQAVRLKLLEKGKAMHAEVRRKGQESDPFVGNTLLSLYGKCGSITDAQIVLKSLPCRDVVSWTAILAAYAKQGQAEEAIEVYAKMLEDSISPNHTTFVSLLQACGMLAEKEILDGQGPAVQALGRARAIHGDVCRRGMGSFQPICNSLISMYGKCGSILDAQNVFNNMCQRDVVSWTAMLNAYAQQGQAEKVLQLYEAMEEGNVSPNAWTIVTALQACSKLAEEEEAVSVGGQFIKVKSLEQGKRIHADARRKGHELDELVGNTLVNMYGKCGSATSAWDVFLGLAHQDVISWTMIIAAFTQQGQAHKVLELYMRMQGERSIIPDDITVSCVLQACCSAGRLDYCRGIHHTLSGQLTLHVANTLIHAYGICGSMPDAQSVFDAMLQRDVVSWTALIAGYSRQGDTSSTLQCYEEMGQAGVKPNGVTFLALLAACSHAGLVDRGVELFESMSREYGLNPEAEHYVSMLDILARAGCFRRVRKLLMSMPVKPTHSMWLCLLGACRKHGNIWLAKRAFESAVSGWPTDAVAYILMSSIYADFGMWDMAKDVNLRAYKAGASKKPPGQSWLELAQTLHTFGVRDSKHPQHRQIYDLLRNIRLQPHKPLTVSRLSTQN